jgi:plasmid stability protein
MATPTIRNLDDETKQGLRFRAARHGVSMEQEARIILRAAVEAEAKPAASKESFYGSVRKLVDKYGPFDLDLPPRGPMREPPTFD